MMNWKGCDRKEEGTAKYYHVSRSLGEGLNPRFPQHEVRVLSAQQLGSVGRYTFVMG